MTAIPAPADRSVAVEAFMEALSTVAEAAVVQEDIYRLANGLDNERVEDVVTSAADRHFQEAADGLYRAALALTNP